jgi:hypothetical protein
MTDNDSHADEMNSNTANESTPADGSPDRGKSQRMDTNEPREPITVSDEQPRDAGRGRRDNRPQGQGVKATKQKIVGYLFWGTFGTVFLFGAFSAYGFYQSVIDIIDIWVSEDFEPIFQAVFNLVVVFVAILAISLLVRRLDISFSPSSEESPRPEE